MSEALRLYYLQTMGIDVWKERAPSSICLQTLQSLEKEISVCMRCPLHKTRTQTVFSRGNPEAKLMLIGEAPGFYEDKQGLPFIGKAGGLLDRMMESIGFQEQDYYIANLLKCRPPDNRDPDTFEMNQCGDFLDQQIALVNPHLIVALGRFAGQFLLKKPLPLKALRNQVHLYKQIPFIVTYHPAYLLRNPLDKKKAYVDLLSCLSILSERT